MMCWFCKILRKIKSFILKGYDTDYKKIDKN